MRLPEIFTLSGSSQAPTGAAGAQQGADVQAQWAEYYRSLGYGAYYGQQGAGAPAQASPPTTTASEEKKVCRNTPAFTGESVC